MKRHIFSTALLLLFIASVTAQKEVYFNVLKEKDIKVESMNGLEARISLIPDAFSIFNLPENYNLAFYIGYFSEKRICDVWTLNYSFGIHNVINKMFILQKDSIGNIYGYDNNYKLGYSLLMEAGIQPRLYLNFKKRYQLGKTKLNSGWFLSFPLLFQTTLLQTPEPLINQGWFPAEFYGSLIFTPTLGYRKAFSNRFFIEGNVGAGITSFLGIHKSTSYIQFPYFYPSFNIKAAYTFK